MSAFARSKSRLLLRTAFLAGGLGIGAPAFAQTCSLPVAGIITCPAGPPVTALTVAGSATPVNVVLNDGFNTLGTVDLASLAGAAVNVTSLGASAINTVNQPGLIINSGSGINAQVNTLTTAGDGATGALLRGVDDVIFTSSDLVSTTGNAADAINAQGRSVTVNGNVVRTSGNDSNGLNLVSLNGPINANANTLQTNGLRSDAEILRGAGNITTNAGVIQTNGDQALGANISNDAAACVLLGNGGCGVNMNAGNITTNGFGSIGALVSAAGRTNININALQTNGDQAAGLDLSTDPTACVALGVGSCGSKFTVGSLTTNGANAPAALVNVVGPTTANIGLLTTHGDNSAGLDLNSDPTACATLGAGACDTSFSVGQLTTSGAGATGALIRAAGRTNGTITTAATSGVGANAIDIAADPTACALLGAGACDVRLTGGNVSTTGNGAAGVLVNAPGQIVANLTSVTTQGNNAPAIGVITDPVVCAAIGPGTCGVQVSSGNVGTTGSTSPGTTVTSPGPITIGEGTVTTVGPNSPGVVANGGDGPIAITVTSVSTLGDDSPGISATGTGTIGVTAGSVTTAGNGSDGITITGGAGPVTVAAGPITTTGSGSTGISVTTTTGAQSITTGGITVSGPGANGITAVASGCAPVNIVATGPVSSAQGVGISASSACSVRITTLPGAPVSGAVAGINAVSGTGTTVVIGDRLSSSGGPALNVDGAGANVVIQGTGTLVGRVDLTDNDDTLVNRGRFEASGTSAFGLGNDSFINSGTLAVLPNAVSAGAVAFTGLENTTNAGGLIDLRNGHTGDTLTLSGNFTGTGASRLGLDVNPLNPAGTDQLIIAGAATGNTSILLNGLGTGPGSLVNGLVLVDAGAGTSAGAFTQAGGPVTQGFITYSVAYVPAANDFALFGVPNASAYELVELQEGARQLFYRTDDAIGGHFESLTDQSGARSSAETERPRSSALWFVPYGNSDRYRRSMGVSAFGQASNVSLSYEQDVFGGQAGYDFGIGRNGSVLGVTGGYANSLLRFTNTADRYVYNAANVGVYGHLLFGPAFLNALARYEHYWIDVTSRTANFTAKPNGDSFGGELQLGARIGPSKFFIEPRASIEYVHTSIDTIAPLNASFDFDASDGVRGKAGARVGTTLTSGGPNVVQLYLGGDVVHEFRGRDGVTFANNGMSLGFESPQLGTYGQASLGFNAQMGTRVSGFVEVHGDWSDSYRGGGGRGGISIRF